MTREEAIEATERVKEIIEECTEYGNEVCCVTSNEADALNMVIKALEQELILDKIRAEIKALNPEPTAYDVVDGNPIKDAVWETLTDVLQIIDKYKAEMEGEE